MLAVREDIETTEASKVRFLGMLKVLLGQKYKDPIDQFVQISVEPDATITGVFQSARKFIRFRIEMPEKGGIDVSYQQAKINQDAWLQSYAEASDRLDAVRKRSGIRRKKNICTIGTSCGTTCIEADDTCNFDPRDLPPKEFTAQLRTQAVAIAASNNAQSSMTSPRGQTEPGESVGEPDPGSEADPLEGKTIRDLKRQAADLGIYRYGTLTVSQLKQSINAAKADPELQESLRRTIARRQATRNRVKGLLPKPFRQLYKELQKLHGLKQIGGVEGATLAASILMGVYASSVASAKGRYQSSLNESAISAGQRAQGIPVERTGKPNIIFTVAGTGDKGSDSGVIKDLLEKGDNNKADRWFKAKNEIIPFTHTDLTNELPGWAKGNGPAAAGFVAKGTFGKYLNNLARGNNEAATDLAAKLYAYGNRHPNAGLNLIGHGVGGQVNRSALEILKRIKPSGRNGVPGESILARVKMVNTGTPHFGFSDDRAIDKVPQRNIITAKDPFAILPKKLPQWINSVKSGRIEDYFTDPTVRDAIRQNFGYYSNSLSGEAQRAKRRQENNKAISGALKEINPAAGRVWDKVTSIGEKAKDNPIAAGITAAGLIGGGGVFVAKQVKAKNAANLTTAALEVAIAAETSRSKLQNTHIANSNVMFVVGGNGVSSKEFAKKLEKAKLSTADKAFVQKQNYKVAFERDAEVKPPAGLDPSSPAYMAAAVQGAYKKTIGTLNEVGRNPEAIKLASELLAYAEHNQRRPGQKVNRLPINVVAYADGGLIAREASEILGKTPQGRAILDQVHLTTFGTPSFGINPGRFAETNVMGDRDGWTSTPFLVGGAKTVKASGVDGHSLDDYLISPDAMAKGFSTMKATGRSRTKEVELAKVVGAAVATAEKIEADPVLKEARENPNSPEDPRTKIPNFSSWDEAQQVKALKKWSDDLYGFLKNNESVKEGDKFAGVVATKAEVKSAAALRGAPRPPQEVYPEWAEFSDKRKISLTKTYESAVLKFADNEAKADRKKWEVPRSLSDAEGVYLSQYSLPTHRGDWKTMTAQEKKEAWEDYVNVLTEFDRKRKEDDRAGKGQKPRQLQMTPLMLEIEKQFSSSLKTYDPRLKENFNSFSPDEQTQMMLEYIDRVESYRASHIKIRRAQGEIKLYDGTRTDVAMPSQTYLNAYRETCLNLDRASAKCKPGNKRCGDRCIPDDQDCHVGKGTAGVAAGAAVFAVGAIATAAEKLSSSVDGKKFVQSDLDNAKKAVMEKVSPTLSEMENKRVKKSLGRQLVEEIALDVAGKVAALPYHSRSEVGSPAMDALASHMIGFAVKRSARAKFGIGSDDVKVRLAGTVAASLAFAGISVARESKSTQQTGPSASYQEAYRRAREQQQRREAPSRDTDPNWHKTLGVKPNATPDEVKAAFRRLSKQYHPDVSKLDSKEAAAKFNEITKAFKTYRDMNRKDALDLDSFLETCTKPRSPEYWNSYKAAV